MCEAKGIEIVEHEDGTGDVLVRGADAYMVGVIEEGEVSIFTLGGGAELRDILNKLIERWSSALKGGKRDGVESRDQEGSG